MKMNRVEKNVVRGLLILFTLGWACLIYAVATGCATGPRLPAPIPVELEKAP